MKDDLNEKEEIKKKEPDVKTKRKKAKIAVLSLSTFVVLFVGLQVYASTNGYGNVFFMIKEWVTGEKVVEEGKIFSDQEITLSYRSIELAEGLKIQVNRLEIKDGKTRLYAVVKAEDGKQLPLKYEVYSESKEGTSVTRSTNKKIVGVKPQNEAEHSYTEVLELDYAIKENATLVVKISDTNDKELKTLEINLDTREITVKGEEKLEKISKIELKKYLDIFLLMNDPSNYTESDNLIEISAKIQAITDSKISIKRETINEIVKEFYGEKAKFETVKDAQGKDVEILKDMRVGRYDKESDDYELMEHDRFGKCLKIESASYENGVYTIKYIYTLANQFDEDKDNLEDLPQYETTIQLKRVEGNKYSKYQIVSIGNATQIKEKVNTTVTEENQNDEEDFEYIFDVNKDNNTNDGNSTSSEPQMGQTRKQRYEEYAKKANLVEVEDQVTDMKIKVPSEFATTIQTTDSDMFIESVGDEYWTDGQNTKICINVYRPRLITTNSAEYSNAEKVANTENDVGLNSYTTGMWHQTSVPANALTRGNKGERYTNYKKVDKGYVESRVDILFYNNFDGELDWIEGEVLSSHKVGRIPEAKPEEVTTSNEQEFNLENYLNNSDNVEEYVAVPGYIINRYKLGYFYLEPIEEQLKLYLNTDNVKITKKRSVITGTRGTVRKIYDYDNYKGTVGSMLFIVYGTGDIGYMTPYNQIKDGVVPEEFEVDGYIHLNTNERVVSLENDNNGDLYAVMENTGNRVKIWNRGADKSLINN